MRCHFAILLTANIGVLIGSVANGHCKQFSVDEAEPAWGSSSRVEAFDAGVAQAVLSLPLRQKARPVPVVILVHDALGPDQRGEGYITQLNGAAIAVLDVLGPDDVRPVLGAIIDRVSEDVRLDGSQIGILGFGAGGGVAIETSHRLAARALLYPGCSTARLPPDQTVSGVPWLLMHGAADPANPPADCEQLARDLAGQGGVVRHIRYAHAGYAWDRPSFGAEGSTLLPAPGQAGRIRAAAWSELAALSATEVASFFVTAFRSPSQ